MTQRPEYDHFRDMNEVRGPLGSAFARQALLTVAPWLPNPAELDVLDVGSGYGHTAHALAESCRLVVGVEPARQLHATAVATFSNISNLSFELGGVEQLNSVERYDLIVLDNVYEHLPNHALALDRISRALRPGGVLFLLTPNKAWPVEAHYRLPLLSWCPLPLANRYLRTTGRGADYTDASYAPTYRSLGRDFAKRPELSWRCVLPGDPTATVAGAGKRVPPHYRVGMAVLRKYPVLWSISKALLVVAIKDRQPSAERP